MPQHTTSQPLKAAQASTVYIGQLLPAVCSPLYLLPPATLAWLCLQKSSSVVKTNCSKVMRSPVRFDITPAFWYSPTRRSKKLALP